ncbi:triacylglycerol lipase (plasmid) [Pseudoalteromonas xiamenensis]|uniref:esterase/lipase family protein n=1 Tax=Pseudoalteromonas xiamenensis TaxID=882626 RepID=UPI0027E4319F|nr:triacylglycerol lipase [Pseudoalteromonas xiamenensis]WMN61886.1 triacylglycerol lipase [Pseudoalteromonas xiamenensis]
MKKVKQLSIALSCAVSIALSCQAQSEETIINNELSVSGVERYPIVLVHGLFGFDNLLGFDYFYRVPQIYTQQGREVFVANVSAANSSELRGEQLLEQVAMVRALTGAEKVHLIGHSQGSQTSRYVASVNPAWVATVASVGGVNWGSEFADAVRGHVKPGTFSEAFLASLASGLANFIGWLSGKGDVPEAPLEALETLTTRGTLAFNAKYPEGIPSEYCGQSSSLAENGVRYYSWSGQSAYTNVFDPADAALLLFSKTFSGKNDGLVSACSSHLGQVIGTHYKMNHLDEVNHFVGIHHLFDTDPLTLYRQHGERLNNLGL